MKTHTVYSAQFDCPAVVVSEQQDNADWIIDECRAVGAIFYEDGPDDECFVAVLRPDVGPELWTDRALRAKMRQRSRAAAGGS